MKQPVTWDPNPKTDEVEVLHSDEATVVRVSVGHLSFTGTAKVHPDDMPGDKSVGYHLAMSRALRKLQRYHARQARERLELLKEARK